MRTLLAALFLSTALLSGCASAPAPAPAPSGLAAADPTIDGAADAAATPGTEAGVASAVCSVKVNLGTGVGGNLHMTYLGCAFEKAADGDLSRFGSALVEVAWPDPLPTVMAFEFFLLSDSCDFDAAVEPCYHDHISSQQPAVRYEVPAETLRDFGDDRLRAYASVDGVAVQQEIVIAVTLVPAGHVLETDYTALP